MKGHKLPYTSSLSGRKRAYNTNDVYEYIVAYKMAHDGLSPSYRQIAGALGMPSNNTAYNFVHDLAALGLIRLTGQRGIKVVGGKWSPPTVYEPG